MKNRTKEYLEELRARRLLDSHRKTAVMSKFCEYKRSNPQKHSASPGFSASECGLASAITGMVSNYLEKRVCVYGSKLFVETPHQRLEDTW